uniref:5'-3' exonuclease domain-containing protein n=1 Tax=viral metagenome TaxID=1070528 RepID=A0A6C0DGC6_9ZZZZ
MSTQMLSTSSSNTLPTTNSNSAPIFIFIDGSYFCFYRYYSILNWWKLAHSDENLEDPITNNEFVEKFTKTFIDTLKQIPKKLKLNNLDSNPPTMIVGRDCKRENIWRNDLYDKYKANRVCDSSTGFMGGPFFKKVYEEEIFQKGGATKILHHPKLEADDCIAIYVKELLNIYPDCSIYIITSDNDYLQLIRENVHIYNLTFKNLKDSKIFTGIAEKDLQLKILMGDSSDNIPSVFPKCGIKTALKCVDDPEYFKKKMGISIQYHEQYILNETLVSFDKIPKDLVNDFLATNTIL